MREKWRGVGGRSGERRHRDGRRRGKRHQVQLAARPSPVDRVRKRRIGGGGSKGGRGGRGGGGGGLWPEGARQW